MTGLTFSTARLKTSIGVSLGSRRSIWLRASKKTRWATLFLPSRIRQLMNLLASFEPNRGSGLSWALLAVNLRDMRGSWGRSDSWGCPWGLGRGPPVYFFLPLVGTAALLEAPYFDRACLRSATPRLSSTPRTM